MVESLLPPYYEVARLTHQDDGVTLRACIDYRRTPAPSMSLSWLRDAAYQVLSGQLTVEALHRTIDHRLPANARASVKRAVFYLTNYAHGMQWAGERLPEFSLEVGRGAAIPVRAVGRFHSKVGRWVVGLQPRLDHGPDLGWQMQTWLGLLNESYCTDPLAPAVAVVLDLSRDEQSGSRGFNVVRAHTSSLIDRRELNGRINRFLDCYKRAIEIVPTRPTRPRRRPPSGDQPPLPGI